MKEKDRFFDTILRDVPGPSSKIVNIKMATGGMINRSYVVETTSGRYFVKCNDDPEVPDLFEKEAEGLKALDRGIIKVPEVVALGKMGNLYYLILEYISASRPAEDFWDKFGYSLSVMHKQSSEHFGWHTDNHIGKLPQKNEPCEEWIDFFVHCRLIPQVKMARDKHLITEDIVRKFDHLYPRLDSLLPPARPSILHGDLWSGNFMTGPDGHVVLIDPAVYFGHREAELAFTRLFGGFEPRFYQVYNESFPLAPGFEDRLDVYNLYPLLVHVNLFGTSYLSGIIRTLKRII